MLKKNTLETLAVLISLVVIIGGLFSVFSKESDTDQESIISNPPLAFVYSPTTQDETNVYFDDEIIPNADPATFEALGGMYLKDKNTVFVYSCWGEGYPGCVVPLEGADSKSFKVLRNFLAKDSSHVFQRAGIIENADPDTFVIVLEDDRKTPWMSNLIYLKDKSYVFYTVFGFSVLPNADPVTFEALSWKYSKDKNNVYNRDKIIPNADLATFEVLDDELNEDHYLGYFTKDVNNVYYDSNIILDADPATFKLLGAGFSKDNKNVYRINSSNKFIKMPDLNVDTFKVVGVFTINNNIVYYNGLKMLNIDAETLAVFEGGYGYYTKDKNSVFYKTKKTIGADPVTFKIDSNTGGIYDSRDKNNYYYSGNLVILPPAPTVAPAVLTLPSVPTVSQ